MFIALQEMAYMTVKAKSINASLQMTVPNFIEVLWELGLNPNTISLSMLTNADRIIESFRLEKTLKITESNQKPNTAKSTTKPCP